MKLNTKQELLDHIAASDFSQTTKDLFAGMDDTRLLRWLKKAKTIERLDRMVRTRLAG